MRKKKKEHGLERLRAEFNRFRHELSSIRSPCCSYISSTRSSESEEDSNSDKNMVWDSTECLKKAQQDLSKAAVEQWDCSPRSRISDSTNNVHQIGDCSSTPKVRITATTLFTANRGQVFIDECKTEHTNPEAVSRLTHEVPRVTSPPSKSPRDPTPRSDVNSALQLPAGEMVLASNSMNIHIGDAGVASPVKTIGVSSPAKALGYPAQEPSTRHASPQHKFVKPAASKRLSLKIKDILQNMDKDQPVNRVVLGKAVIETGADQAQAYLEDIVSALSGRSRVSDVETNALSTSQGPDTQPVATIVSVEAAPQTEDKNHVNTETQVALISEPCTVNKFIQCFLPVETHEEDHSLLNKETQCSDLSAVLPDGDASRGKVKINYHYRYKGKAKEEAAEDYVAKLKARRAYQTDEFLQRCREKVGNLLQGCRILETAARNPNRADMTLETGESSTFRKDITPREDFRGVLSTIDPNAQSRKPAGEYTVTESKFKKVKGKVYSVKESKSQRAKPPPKPPSEVEFDYDQIYKELGDLIRERGQIEQLDRTQRKQFDIPYCEVESVPLEAAKPLASPGAKRARTTRSPAREQRKKLLRLNAGKFQYDTSPASEPRKQLLRLNAGKFQYDPNSEKTKKTPKTLRPEIPTSSKKEKVPAWVTRMTQSKSRFTIFDELEKEEPDKLSLSGTHVKRRNVRPPESIFKAGKPINWLSNLPNQQAQQEHDSKRSDDKKGYNKKRNRLFHAYKLNGTHHLQDMHDQGTSCPDDSDASVQNQELDRVFPKQSIPKTSWNTKQQRYKDGGGEKRKQDWVVVGDFCISELEKKGTSVGGHKKTVTESFRYTPQEDVAGPFHQLAREPRKQLLRLNAGKFQYDISSGDEAERKMKKPAQDTKKERGKWKKQVKADEGKQEMTQARDKGKQVIVEPRYERVEEENEAESSASIVHIPENVELTCQQTESCRKSLEEELFKQSLLEVLLQDLLNDEDQARTQQHAATGTTETTEISSSDFLSRFPPVRDQQQFAVPARQYICTKHGTSEAGQLPSSSQAQQAVPPISQPSTGPQHIVTPEIKLTIDIVDSRREEGLSKPSTSEVLDTSQDAHQPLLQEPPPVKQVQIKPKPTALARSLAFHEERPSDLFEELQRSDSFQETQPLLEPLTVREEEGHVHFDIGRTPQRTVGIQLSGVPGEQPSISILPIPFPVIFPLQQPPQSQPAQTTIETTVVGHKTKKKQTQAALASPSTSPSTPSTPSSSPEREATIQAILAPVRQPRTSPRRAYDSGCSIIITGIGDGARKIPHEDSRGKSARREMASWEQYVGLVERTSQQGSPRSSLVVEEQHTLSRTKLRYQEEDITTVSRDYMGKERDRVTHHGNLESPSSSPCKYEEEDAVRVSRESMGRDGRRLLDLEQLESPPSSPVPKEKKPYEKQPATILVISEEKPRSARSKQKPTVLSRSLAFREDPREQEMEHPDIAGAEPEPTVNTLEEYTTDEEEEKEESTMKILNDYIQSEHEHEHEEETAEEEAAMKSLDDYVRGEQEAEAHGPTTTKPQEQDRQFLQTYGKQKPRRKEDFVQEAPEPPRFLGLQQHTVDISESPRQHVREECRLFGFDSDARQPPIDTTPRLLPSKLNLQARLERAPRGKSAMLFGRQVLPSRDVKILADLERKAAAALKGKSFANTRALGKQPEFSQEYIRCKVADTSESTSSSGNTNLPSSSNSGDSEYSTGSGNASEARVYATGRRSQLSEGEIDPGEVSRHQHEVYRCYHEHYAGDETPEEGETSLGEIR